MSRATRLESYMLSLINSERVDAGLRPLRFDGDLNQAADAHSHWMLMRDVFAHQGVGGSDMLDRARDAGYRLTGAWAIGENLGLHSKGGAKGLRDEVRAIHEGLMDSPGHRANILSRSYDEIGVGIKLGEYKGMTVVMVTQDFARTSAEDRTARTAMTNTPDDFVFAATAKAGAQDDHVASYDRQAPSFDHAEAYAHSGAASPFHDIAWADLL